MPSIIFDKPESGDVVLDATLPARVSLLTSVVVSCGGVPALLRDGYTVDVDDLAARVFEISRGVSAVDTFAQFSLSSKVEGRGSKDCSHRALSYFLRASELTDSVSGLAKFTGSVRSRIVNVVVKYLVNPKSMVAVEELNRETVFSRTNLFPGTIRGHQECHFGHIHAYALSQILCINIRIYVISTFDQYSLDYHVGNDSLEVIGTCYLLYTPSTMKYFSLGFDLVNRSDFVAFKATLMKCANTNLYNSSAVYRASLAPAGLSFTVFFKVGGKLKQEMQRSFLPPFGYDVSSRPFSYYFPPEDLFESFLIEPAKLITAMDWPQIMRKSIIIGISEADCVDNAIDSVFVRPMFGFHCEDVSTGIWFTNICTSFDTQFYQFIRVTRYDGCSRFQCATLGCSSWIESSHNGLNASIICSHPPIVNLTGSLIACTEAISEIYQKLNNYALSFKKFASCYAPFVTSCYFPFNINTYFFSSFPSFIATHGSFVGRSVRSLIVNAQASYKLKPSSSPSGRISKLDFLFNCRRYLDALTKVPFYHSQVLASMISFLSQTRGRVCVLVGRHGIGKSFLIQVFILVTRRNCLFCRSLSDLEDKLIMKVYIPSTVIVDDCGASFSRLSAIISRLHVLNDSIVLIGASSSLSFEVECRRKLADMTFRSCLLTVRLGSDLIHCMSLQQCSIGRFFFPPVNVFSVEVLLKRHSMCSTIHGLYGLQINEIVAAIKQAVRRVESGCENFTVTRDDYASCRRVY